MPVRALFQFLFASLALVVFGSDVVAQNGIIGAGFSSGWSNPANINYFSASAGSSRIYTTTASGTGNQYFRMVRGWGGDNTEYAQPGCTDLSIAVETEISSLTSCGSGAYYLNVASTSDNYIFKTPDGASGTSVIVFQVQGTVNTISSVSQSPTDPVMPGSTVTVSAEVSGGAALPSGQGVYLRYTDDGFTSSTVVELTYGGSGGTYTGTIPAGTNVAGASVSYYLFTSGDGLTISGTNADWYSINLNNNGGSNYSYTVPNCTCTQADGAWNNAGTWDGGVPAEGSDVCILNAVTMDDNHSVDEIWISAAGSVEDASHTLTVTNNLANYGSHSGTGKIYLNGSSGTQYLSGGGSYGNVELNDANNAEIADGGSIGNLTISLGAFTLTGSSSLTVTGNVDITGNLSLSTTSGGDLYVGGDWTRAASGSFTHNSRLVSFNGTALQTISVTGGGTEVFAYLRCDKSAGDLRLDDSPATDIAVTSTSGDVLQLTNGTIDLNGRTFTLSGQGGNILLENGARQISGGSGSVFKLSGTSTLVSKTITRNDGASTLTVGSNVNMEITDGGIDFGSGLTTIDGDLELLTQGFVSNNSPAYGGAATLTYNNGGTFQRNIEWNDASIFNVIVKSGTTLDMYTNDPGGTRTLAGDLTIENGAFLYCGLNPTNRTADVVVGGSLYVDGLLDMDDMDKASFDVADDVVISATGTLDMSNLFGGDLKVGGDFTNNGTFNCNDRAVFFDGSAMQFVSGTSSISFDYLFTQNTGAGITLQRAITITDTLHLSDGPIITTDANLLTMTAASAMSTTLPGSADSYIDGPMAKDFTSTNLFVFPLGESGIWAPAGIQPAGATATTFKAEYIQTDPTSDGYNRGLKESSLDHVSQVEYWELDRTSGTENANTIRLYWGGHSIVNDGALNATMRVAHWHSGDGEWKNEGGTTISGDTLSGYVESGVVTSFSPFSLASADANNPLPVELTSFTAERVDAKALLSWETAGEINNDYFTVERAGSAQPDEFETVGIVQGAGNTNVEQAYSLWDDAPHSGINFYRLRQTDFDGKSSVSQVRTVVFSDPSKLIRNLSLHNGQLHFTATGNDSAPMLVRIMDARGRMVLSTTINPIESQATQLAVPECTSNAVYFVTLLQGDRIESYKVLVP